MRVLAGFLSQPICLSLLLLLLAALLRWRSRMRLARIAGVLALLILWMGSSEVFANLLIGPLDSSHAPLSREDARDARFIAVLGSGNNPAPGVSAVGALDADGLTRIMEALRLARERPGCTLVLSGGAAEGMATPARGYERLVREIDGDRWPLVVLDTPRDTAAEARQLKQRIGDADVIIVTSNYHMPRAMLLLEREGVRAHAAPAGAPTRAQWAMSAWMPSAAGVRKTERALHEYFGILATRMGLV